MDSTPDRVDEAAKAIDQALTDQQKDPITLATAGRVYVAKHEYSKAADYLEQAVKLKPDYAQARFTLAQAYRALGRKEDAARESEAFQKLRQAKP
jgi:uncharacterized protein HemY